MPDISPPVFDLQTSTEATVLGAIFVDEHQAIDRMGAPLPVSAFMNTTYRQIYTTMLALNTRGVPIDPVSVVAELPGQNAHEVVGDLMGCVPTAANISYHANLLREWDRKRQLKWWFEGLARRDASADELTAEVQEGLNAMSGLSALPAADAASNVPPGDVVRWTIDGFWPTAEIGLLVGDGGSFKSTAAAHLCGAIAGGYRAFTRFATVQAPTLYVSAEDPKAMVGMRLRAFCEGHSWDADRVLQNVHILADPAITLSDPVWRGHLMREAKRLKVGFIVLDPLADLLGGDENSNTEMRPVVAFLRKVAKETDAAIAVVHHAGKAGPERRQIDRIRGASALHSASRAVFFFDYNANGVTVTNLKQSRGHRVDTFVLERAIEHEQGNPGAWWSARLTLATAQDATLKRAEEWVFQQICDNPELLNTSALKDAGGVAGFRGQDVSSALANLGTAGRITFVGGEKGKAKFWRPTIGNEASGNGQKNDLAHLALKNQGKVPQTLPTLPKGLRARSNPQSDPPRDLAPPLGGQGKVAGKVRGSSGSGDQGRDQEYLGEDPTDFEIEF